MKLTFCPRPYFASGEEVIVHDFVGPFGRVTLTEEVTVLSRGCNPDPRRFRYVDITGVQIGTNVSGGDNEPLSGLHVSDREKSYVVNVWRPPLRR